MNFKKSISSLKLPHYKSTAAKASVPVAPPAEVLLPMNMHSGQAAEPVVAVGDYVRVGQLIAREEGRNSSPVYASISGTVAAIEPYESEPGRKTQAILIKGDGKMEVDPSVQPPEIHDLDSFLAAVRQSGIVGLGGAAFPLWAKLDAIRFFGAAPESLTLETATKCAADWTFSDNLGNLQFIANTPLGGVGYRESGNTAYGIGYLAQNGGKNVATYNSWWHATADRRQVHTLTARLMPGASNNTFLMDGVADPKAQSSNFWQDTAALAAVYRFFANSRADVTAHSVRLYARRLAERRVPRGGSGGRDPAHVRPAAGAVPRPSAGRDPRGRRPPAFRRRLPRPGDVDDAHVAQAAEGRAESGDEARDGPREGASLGTWPAHGGDGRAVLGRRVVRRHGRPLQVLVLRGLVRRHGLCLLEGRLRLDPSGAEGRAGHEPRRAADRRGRDALVPRFGGGRDGSGRDGRHALTWGLSGDHAKWYNGR